MKRYSQGMTMIKSCGLFITALSLFVSFDATGQEIPSEKEPAKTSKTELSKREAGLERLALIKKEMDADPQNLRAYVDYARLASRLGKVGPAIKAYNHILKINPGDNRTKLDLGLLYERIRNISRAKKLLTEVLETDPPEQVRKNIQIVLDRIDAALEKKKQAEAPAESQETAAQEQTPPEERLEMYDLKIQENRNDLDAYFGYARAATELGKADAAIDAYRVMLKKNPQLHRVKLDLSLLYMKTGKFKEAKVLLDDVLKTNPPEQVKNNINTLLATIEQALKKDLVSVSVSFGYNNDTNANSAAATGQTTLADISIELAPGSTQQRDGHTFLTGSISHLHKFDIDSSNFGASITTTGTLYRTYQESEHNLELALASVKTGPTFEIAPLKSQLAFSGTYSVITLDSFKYMKTRSGDVSWKFAPFEKWIFDNSFAYEYRKFANSPSVLTNVDRTGNAFQNVFGITYALSEKDVFNTTATWRNETARDNKYGLDQITWTASHTHQFPWDIALNTLLSFKKTHYNELDTTISTTKLRNDRERSATFTLAKSLPYNVTLSTSYQYKNITSNIQNYTYHNHRVSGNVAWSF